VGVAPAVDTHQGILVQPLTHVTVEALPTEVPSVIEADVTVLDEIDDALHVSDLSLPEGVEMITDPAQMIAKVAPPVVEVVDEVEEEEGLEEGEEGEEGEAEEGAEEAAQGEGERER